MAIQVNLCAVYPDGAYTRTRDLAEAQEGFERELKKYDADYADIDLIHCMDDIAYFERIMAMKPFGVGSVDELKAVLGYHEATAKDRGYSFIGNLPRLDMQGACIYCNHCQPCHRE